MGHSYKRDSIGRFSGTALGKGGKTKTKGKAKGKTKGGMMASGKMPKNGVAFGKGKAT